MQRARAAPGREMPFYEGRIFAAVGREDHQAGRSSFGRRGWHRSFRGNFHLCGHSSLNNDEADCRRFKRWPVDRDALIGDSGRARRVPPDCGERARCRYRPGRQGELHSTAPKELDYEVASNTEFLPRVAPWKDFPSPTDWSVGVRNRSGRRSSFENLPPVSPGFACPVHAECRPG